MLLKAIPTLLLICSLATVVISQKINILPYGQLDTDFKKITSLAFNEQSDRVIVTDQKGNVQLWDISSFSKIATADFSEEIIFSSFINDDKTILLINEDGKILHLNSESLSEEKTSSLPDEPEIVSLHPDGTEIAYINKDGELKLFTTRAGMLRSSIDLNDRVDDVLFIGYDRFGQQLAILDEKGTTLVCDAVNQRIIREVKLRSNEFSGSASVVHAAGSNKGSDLFITGVQEVFIPKGGLQGGQPERRNSILAYDWDTSNEVKRIRVNDRVDQIEIGPGPANMTYFTNKRLEVTVVGIDLGAEMSAVTLTEYPTLMSISNDDEFLAVADDEGVVNIYELARNAAPSIKIINPPVNRGIGANHITDERVELVGALSDDTKVKTLKVNGKEIDLSSDGKFRSDLNLRPGQNKVRIIAEDYQSNTIIKDIFLTHTPEQLNPEAEGSSDQKRLALIIGNAAYEGVGALNNTVNDANAMTTALEKLGFDVTTITDSDYEEMKRAIYKFGDAIRDVDVTLFYYAGHGVEIDGENYLVPVDANLNSTVDVRLKTIPLSGILRTMTYANEKGLNMIILDACRNNPFPTGNRGGAGLAEEQPPSGTLIAYSTAPGKVASDGEGSNGLYTGELIRQLLKPQRIEDVFMQTRINVEEKSDGRQQPWEEARLKGVFYLNY